jgi:hypothetical protein
MKKVLQDLPNQRRRSLAVAGLFISAAMGSALFVAAPAHAATVCNPDTWRFEVREAGAGIGDLRINTNVCMNGKTMTSSTSSVTWTPSPLGGVTGWVFSSLGTSRVATGSNYASWVSNGVFKLCVPTQISPLCSYGEQFRATYNGYASSFVGPIPTPSIKCTNSYCSNKMTFVFKAKEQ